MSDAEVVKGRRRADETSVDLLVTVILSARRIASRIEDDPSFRTLLLADWMLLRLARSKSEMNLRRIATMIGVDPKQAQQQAEDLHKAGYLEFHFREEGEKRLRCIALTKKGMEVLDAAENEIRRIGATIPPEHAGLALEAAKATHLLARAMSSPERVASRRQTSGAA